MDLYFRAACEAARVGGDVLRSYRGKFTTSEKSPKDLVTDADLASQKAIREFIFAKFPKHAFLGEESTPDERQKALASDRPLWVVDPLDGTANYVHNLQNYAVSVALVSGADVVVGAVFDPTSNSMFSASIDGPATLNNRVIRCSQCTQLDQAMVACSFPAGVKRTDPEVGQFVVVLERCQSIRRLGSAALNLCYVAAGSLDAYWVQTIQPWDVAAGYLIAQRAGAKLSNTSGGAFELWKPNILASSSEALHQSLLDCLASPL